MTTTPRRPDGRRPRPAPGRIALALAIALAAAAAASGWTGAAASPGRVGGQLPVIGVLGQVPAPTSTTQVIPTTTLAPTTVATTTPTTPPTTARPTTALTPLTTAVAPVTSSALATTSTTVAPADDGTETWLIVLLIVLAVLAIIAAVAVVVALGRRREPVGNWEGEVRAALVDVDLSIDLATAHSETPDPRPFGQVVTPRLSSVRSRLESVASQAPNPHLRQEVAAVASGVQSYGSAAEAEWTLRQSAVAPSAEQLNEAGSASFERRAALQSSVTMLRSEIG